MPECGVPDVADAADADDEVAAAQSLYIADKPLRCHLRSVAADVVPRLCCRLSMYSRGRCMRMLR